MICPYYIAGGDQKKKKNSNSVPLRFSCWGGGAKMPTQEKKYLGNQGILAKSRNWVETEPSAWKQNCVNSDQNLPGSKYQSFVVLSF